MERLASRQTGLPIDPRTGDYFRDVHDHLLRDVDRIAAFDEILTGALQANLAQLQMRDNADIRRISAWVAILAVPTMVFGLYGMNFEHMSKLAWTIGYPAVLLLTRPCVGLHMNLRALGLAKEGRCAQAGRGVCGERHAGRCTPWVAGSKRRPHG